MITTVLFNCVKYVKIFKSLRSRIFNVTRLKTEASQAYIAHVANNIDCAVFVST